MKVQGIQHIIVGFILAVFGAVAPFLMVLRIINISFWISTLSYSASVLGLFIGVPEHLKSPKMNWINKRFTGDELSINVTTIMTSGTCVFALSTV